MRENNNPTNPYKEKLDGYNVPPPSQLWERISHELPTALPAPKPNVWSVRIWAAAAVIALLAISSLTLLFQNEVPQNRPTSPNATESSYTAHIPTPTLPSPEIVEEIERPTPTSAPKAVKRVERQSVTPAIQQEETEGTPTQEKKVEKTNPQPKVRKTPERLVAKNELQQPQNKPKPKTQKRWSLSMAGGNQLLASSSQTAGFDNLSGAAPIKLQSISNSPEGYAFQRVTASEIAPQGATTSTTYHVPITFAATVRYNLNDRWALESGLSYTLLGSELTAGGELFYTETCKQHYVGIPIKAQWHFFHRGRWALYAQGGGSIERCIASRLERTYVLPEEENFTQKENSLPDKKMQYSLLAGIGGEYRLDTHTALFAEPSAIYYIDNQSKETNIHRERALNLNLAVGIRWEF